jgi:hypothetical protein
VPKLLYLIDCDPGVPAGVDGGTPVNRRATGRVDRPMVIWAAGLFCIATGLPPTRRNVQRVIRKNAENGKGFGTAEVDAVLRTANWDDSEYRPGTGMGALLLAPPTVKWHRVERSEIRALPGVYAIFGPRRKLLYIGSSVNLQGRLTPKHRILAVFGSACEIRVRYSPAGLHLSREFLLIRRLRPTMNRTHVNAR